MDDVDRANDWVTFEVPSSRKASGYLCGWASSDLGNLRFSTAADNCPYGSISRSTRLRNGVLVGAAIETNFHPPIRTAVINAGVWQTLPLVSVTSHRDPRRINAIFDHVT